MDKDPPGGSGTDYYRGEMAALNRAVTTAAKSAIDYGGGSFFSGAGR